MSVGGGGKRAVTEGRGRRPERIGGDRVKEKGGEKRRYI